MSSRASTKKSETPKELRRRTMQAVKSKNTKPEMAIRRLLHAAGYRYRLHRKDLPGRPDIVFVSRRKIVLVHGCFWHGHKCELGDRPPKSNVAFWEEKFRKNKERDIRNRRKLRRMGWQVFVVWECQMKPRRCEGLKKRLLKFLEDNALSISRI